jgi:hypothetical protein
MRADQDTTIAQALGNFRRHIERVRIMSREHLQELTASTDAFARGQREQGIELALRALAALPPGAVTSTGAAILNASLQQLEESGTAHMEYLVLTLHVLEVSCTV